MIPDEKIPEIRERTDIVALIQQYVPLKRVGASFKGLCPFHTEKSASFHVHPARQFFHCFGCQASGDVITFFMRMEGVPFPEALRTLAERAGVEIPKADARAEEDDRRSRARTDRLVALMDAAAGFYVQQLKEHANSAIARAELDKRGVGAEAAAAFRLGYAPHGWDALTGWLKQQELDLSDAEDLGLVAPRRTGAGHYDRFRHRLMFPVSDHMGRIVAFSGRMLEPPADEPLSDRMEPGAKYINSPENPLYKKGNVLFGLHEGRVEIRRDGWVILCEGNFDLVGLHQAGFKNAVAPLGTALTVEHTRLLKRFAQRVVLLFDGDKAGRKAVRAAFPLLQAQGLAGRVVRLPEGQDPDSFLRDEGAEAMRRRIDAAPSIVEHLIDDTAAEAGGDPAAKAKAIESLGSVLATIENPVEVRLYVERVAQKFGISDIDAVRGQLRRGLRSEQPPARRPNARNDSSQNKSDSEGASPTRSKFGTSVASQPGSTAKTAAIPLSELECELLGVVLDQPTLFETESGQKLVELLTSEDLRHIFLNAKKIAHQRGVVDAPSLLGALEGNSARSWLESRLAVQRYDLDRGVATLTKGVSQLAAETITRERDRLGIEIQAARRAGDEERAMVLTRERDRLFRSARSGSAASVTPFATTPMAATTPVSTTQVSPITQQDTDSTER